ncbi:hypothetical protein K437DRAFT_186425 [Tilletiaria anomala UBC 951]|uniref:Uncharacterized protein n=1 Tax=Tilletiaria anomala (strain ATCC 24038 / CBS 436.72 / UBC 951) TaxID=1037660 RepID=A0A066WPH2_TILAU|nr:uncharacterized protein K437DRAFT_186425 [Tilletiaria anomala UBC 951]KDN52525.1 hypothetical protein K437DRAFT_186425 [Tilletiaria anomala UBC 951]
MAGRRRPLPHKLASYFNPRPFHNHHICARSCQHRCCAIPCGLGANQRDDLRAKAIRTDEGNAHRRERHDLAFCLVFFAFPCACNFTAIVGPLCSPSVNTTPCTIATRAHILIIPSSISYLPSHCSCLLLYLLATTFYIMLVYTL